MTSKLKIVILLLIFFITMSCKKELLTNSAISQKSEVYSDEKGAYIFGINKHTGGSELFQTLSQNPKFLIYGGDMLIYKEDVEVIKQYKLLDKNAIIEIDNLKNKYADSKLKKYKPKASDDSNNWHCVPIYAILWPRSTIYFSVDPNIQEPQLEYIYRAIGEWENETNLTFIEQGWEEENVSTIHNQELHITTSNVDGECLSYVGAPRENGPPAYMALSSSCNYHTILHEFGHVIGYTHEHQRPSRDTYLTMNSATLDEVGNRFGYEIYKILKNQMFAITKVHNDKAVFDFKSIMLYSSYSPMESVQNYLKKINLPLYKTKYGQVINDEDLSSLSEEIIARTFKLYPEPGDICPIED